MSLSATELRNLLQRAKEGRVSPGDLDRVAMEAGDNSPQLYTLLHILGRSGRPEDKRIVSRYVEFPADPQISALALGFLCLEWGECDRFRDTIRNYYKGVSWDRENELRLKAISLAGECSHRKFDKEIVRDLLDIFDESDRDVIRNAAYSALMRASGAEWSRIPSPRVGALEREELNIEALDQLRERVGKAER